MAELFLEILSEEIPAGMQKHAADNFKRLICLGLKEAGLGFSNACVLFTPRRMALVVNGLPVSQSDLKEEKKGPSVSAPEQALSGFLRGNGLKSIDDAEIRELPKGQFYYAVINKRGLATIDVLKKLVLKALRAMTWTKSMRWGNETQRWVRPVKSILCLFESAVVGFEFAGISSGDETFGHRFLSSGSLQVKGYEDYCKQLLAANVMLKPADRIKLIHDTAFKLAE